MFLFVVLAGFIAIILYNQILDAFKHNPGLNALIIGTLLFGVVYTFQQVLRLYPEIRWVNSFRISDPGLTVERPPVMLAPMATMLRRRQGQAALSQVTMQSILDSISSRLDESRETTRYLVGLLVFLGLLGTFWGLMETVQSVGKTIGALSPSGGEGSVAFEELKTGLQAPLEGMGVAFSSSLFGLAGSLIVGFLDLQASQAQTRFYNELEEWLSGITEVASAGEGQGQGGQPAQMRFAMLEMQRSMVDIAEKIEQGIHRSGNNEAIIELSKGIDRLVKQMRAEQKVVREWVDEQAQQHNELANMLREQNKLATILRDVSGRPPRSGGGGDR
jgi:hypothetical protein